jgi:hypothetical protein
MQEVTEDGGGTTENPSSGDNELNSLAGVGQTTEQTDRFFQAITQMTACPFKIELTDGNGKPIETNDVAKGYVTFQIPGQKEPQKIQIQDCTRPVVFPVVLAYSFSQSGSHNSPDYWNVQSAYEVHAQFVVVETRDGISHPLTLVNIPEDKISAGGLNMPPREEMITGLKERDIPEVVEAMRDLDLNGLNLYTAGKAFEQLRSSPTYMRVKVGRSQTL